MGKRSKQRKKALRRARLNPPVVTVDKESTKMVYKQSGPLEAGQHRLAFLKADLLEYPELWSEVYIQTDPAEERMMREWLVKARCYQAKTPAGSDFVIFGGGSDVNPIYYNEDRHETTFFDSKRDEEDVKLYEFCLNEGIPMVGVCRGAQFLHVMNGGKLYQDINNHNTPHAIWDIKGRKSIGRASSVHHQSCRPNVTGGMEILADARVSTERHLNPHQKETGNGHLDIEAFFYRDTCCLGFQGHPEYRGFGEYSVWATTKIQEYIAENPDIGLVRNGGRNRGLKPEFITKREEEWARLSLGTNTEADSVLTDDDIPWTEDANYLDDDVHDIGVVRQDTGDTVTTH